MGGKISPYHDEQEPPAYAQPEGNDLAIEVPLTGFTPDKLQTRAEATMEPGMDPGPTITAIKLTVSASVPGISAAQFEEIAQQAKAGCVISRALSVPVSLEATLL